MRWLLLLAALGIAGEAQAEPSNQEVVFYNARIALRDGKPHDTLKLWLLRNSLRSRGEKGTHDAEFRSAVWAALGRSGICQDGFAKDDEGGAGLWPLALHNWLIRSMLAGPPPDNPPPFDVFEVGRQQRFVSLNDVLSSEELRSVSFFRSSCLQAQIFWFGKEKGSVIDMDDRVEIGLVLEALLEESLETLVRTKVRNVPVVEARLFDLRLALAEMQGQRTRREGRMAALEATNRGVSKVGVEELRRNVEKWPETSMEARFLRRSLTWTPKEWMSLHRARRLDLFAQAEPLGGDREAVAKLALGIVDELVEQRSGEELEDWLGFLTLIDPVGSRTALTADARGQRLLELEPASGFRGRGTVALHRGVAFLEAGDRLGALRSFAYAMQYAQEARDPEVVRSLSRRWLSYVLSRYETTEEVLAILTALVPRQEYNAVIEGLVFRAAFHADRSSFERLTRSASKGGSFEQRLARLRPLAEGRMGDLITELRGTLADEPHAVIRFLDQLLDQLETEDADVRRANVPLLKHARTLISPLVEDDSGNKGLVRRADALLGRTQAVLDGLSLLDESVGGQARAQAPGHETFAGNIRLAPADPLPWPFRPPETAAPSAFEPLVLQPVEWRDAKGTLVFGWRLSE